jgi:hypothetical protein
MIVCYHKDTPRFRSNVLFPVHVGRAGASESLKKLLRDMPGDDEGDNISAKNGSFCELTALYWAWKNPTPLNGADYVGLCHYRRLLGLSSKSGRKAHFWAKMEATLRRGFNLKPKKALLSSRTTREIDDAIREACAQYDVVLPGPLAGDVISVYHYYALWFIESDLQETLSVVGEKYPAMRGAFETVLRSDRAYYCNVLLMRSELWNEYAQWLFDVLFEVERRIGKALPEREPYQRRVYGFLSERLLNVWLAYKKEISSKLRVGELPCYFFEGL